MGARKGHVGREEEEEDREMRRVSFDTILGLF
jgi:hypothetical protein